MNPSIACKDYLPVLPVQQTIVFPHTTSSLFLNLPIALEAVKSSFAHFAQRVILLLIHTEDAPLQIADFYDVGVIGTITQRLFFEEGDCKVIFNAEHRVNVTNLTLEDQVWFANAEIINSDITSGVLLKATKQRVLWYFKNYLQHEKHSIDVLKQAQEAETDDKCLDLIASHVDMSVSEKQAMLQAADLLTRSELLLYFFHDDVVRTKVNTKIDELLRQRAQDIQKQMLLCERKRIIDNMMHDDPDNEYVTLELAIMQSAMPEDVKKRALSDCKRLKQMGSYTSEAGVIDHYLKVLVGLPWGTTTPLKTSMLHSEEILSKHHYGLEKTKELILDYIAAQTNQKRGTGKVLLLVGPPGVGKTSFCKAIADAMGRVFGMIALGGMRDEAEIRGHRRTYIGAEPGRIINLLRQIKTCNPFVLLDEIDKVGKDFRGDVASTLLALLDPEQNQQFVDHYVEVPFDISEIYFVCTANHTANIRPELLDRMHCITLHEYTDFEKYQIFKKYLLPKQRMSIDLPSIRFSKPAIFSMIYDYTREPGVRELERLLGCVCRRFLRYTKFKQEKHASFIQTKHLPMYLGAKRYERECLDGIPIIGQVFGLGWNGVGGSVLKIQAKLLPSLQKETFSITGNLGKIMKESVHLSFTLVKDLMLRFNYPEHCLQKQVHVHFPSGAVKKDGPSAGMAVFFSLLSAFSGIPVYGDVAMTGEISLHGHVLPIGGLKEKLLACKRSGIRYVLIPHDNASLLTDIEPDILDGLIITPVQTIMQAMLMVLTKPLTHV
jgi:ATP-dependent Lon protease